MFPWLCSCSSPVVEQEDFGAFASETVLLGRAASQSLKSADKADSDKASPETPSTADEEPNEAVQGAEPINMSIELELCDQEHDALFALKEELGDADMEAVKSILVPGELLESCLLRFLRPHGLRVRTAAALLRAHLTWRQEMRPKELANLSQGEVAGCDQALLQSYMPTWHQGFDRQGRPVIISHYGKFRFKPVLDAGVTVERILRLHVRNSEVTARLCGEQSQKLGRDISNALIIMDLEGLDTNNLRTWAAFQWARGLAKIDQEHYLDRMGQLLIINAPSYVHFFFQSTSWMLPEKARRRVQIFATREQWLPVLHELIEPSELTPEYGGTRAPLSS